MSEIIDDKYYFKGGNAPCKSFFVEYDKEIFEKPIDIYQAVAHLNEKSQRLGLKCEWDCPTSARATIKFRCQYDFQTGGVL